MDGKGNRGRVRIRFMVRVRVKFRAKGGLGFREVLELGLGFNRG